MINHSDGYMMSLQISQDSELKKVSENIFSVLRNRRAVRGYLDKAVSKELIKALIDFAILAPSAMNLQPWCFVVIQNPKTLKEISQFVKEKLFNNPYLVKDIREHDKAFLNEADYDIFYGASTLIIICAQNSIDKDFNTESDCFLAAENLMLAASGMGLSTCPIGVAIDGLCALEMKKKLGIQIDWTPVLPVVVGYASLNPPYRGRNPAVVKWIS